MFPILSSSRRAFAVVAICACLGCAAPEPQDAQAPRSAPQTQSAPQPSFESHVAPLTFEQVEPKNRQQLRRAIDSAFDAYEFKLRELMLERGEELHGLAAAHELIGQQAGDAYAAFQAEQTRLQNAFNAHLDAR